jgi:transmembrane sensor
MEKFRLLLEAYLNQTATPDQQTELFRLISTGAYDAYLENGIADDLHRELRVGATAAEKAATDQVYGRMAKSMTFSEHSRKADKIWRWWVAAAVVAGLMLGVYVLWPIAKTPDTMVTGPAVDDTTPSLPDLARFTDRQLVVLPDSSTVLLNAGSELTYQRVAYGQESREVTLSGEAYFDIRKDADRPFRVRTGDIVTTVLGTAFNIRATPEREEVRVTVTRGKVQVGDRRQTFGQLVPNEELVVNTNSRKFTKTKTNAETALDWTRNFLILDNIPMESAIKILSEKFGTRLVLKNESLGRCHVSASFFNEEDLDQILQVICTVNQATYERQSDGSIWLLGGNKCE